MKRREFLGAVVGAVATSPPAARAQQAATIRRIGFLGFGTAAGWAPRVEALVAGLRQLDYVAGVNVAFEFRWGETIDRLHEAAADLVRAKVDVIFASTSTEVEVARQATTTIPIVFATHADPVGVGHVASLARPGGNATGLTVVQADLTAKAIEIFKEMVPKVRLLGVLYSPAAPSYRPTLMAVETATKKLELGIRAMAVRTAEDFDNAFATMEQERVQGFFVSASALTLSQRARLAELGLRYRLPGMFGARDNVVSGGLMSYSPNPVELTGRAALYIDKILKGANPADLPVEQASRYQLVINMKTANALGVPVPPMLLARADDVIE